MINPPVEPGRNRGRAGAALIAYGLAGVLVLAVIGAAIGYAGFRAAANLDRLAGARDSLVLILDDTMAALNRAERTTQGVAASLTATSGALSSAVDIAATVSTAANNLADTAESFDIFGQKPLAPYTGDLRKISTSLAELGDRLDTAATLVNTNTSDLVGLGATLGKLATDMQAPRDKLAGIEADLGGAIYIGTFVLLALVAWLLVPALAAIWVGRRWRREARGPG